YLRSLLATSSRIGSPCDSCTEWPPVYFLPWMSWLSWAWVKPFSQPCRRGSIWIVQVRGLGRRCCHQTGAVRGLLNSAVSALVAHGLERLGPAIQFVQHG